MNTIMLKSQKKKTGSFAKFERIEKSGEIFRRSRIEFTFDEEYLQMIAASW